ncbi:MAG: hypothetical protein HC892_16785 [Saprospiraceae bacterium]|nr:hypothetical protein [Saprospiraceae bacterium]
MKNNIILFLLGAVLCFTACEDTELDPLQFDKLSNASILTLRGASFDNLFDRAFLGAVDKFSVSAAPATESFDFEMDFQSEDPANLGNVEVFARATESGARVKVAQVEASAFAFPDNKARYQRAKVSVPLTTILSALNLDIKNIVPSGAMSVTYIYVELDLNLSDGTKVPASAVVNTSLTESTIFFPAHSMLYLAVE